LEVRREGTSFPMLRNQFRPALEVEFFQRWEFFPARGSLEVDGLTCRLLNWQSADLDAGLTECVLRCQPFQSVQNSKRVTP